MKNIILSVFILFCLLSCEQESALVGESAGPTLVGKWQLVEQKVSIGGPASWQKVENGATFDLKADGSFLGFQMFNDCETGTYEAVAAELILTYNCEASESFIYAIQKKEEAIILSPKTIICTDGCEYKYQKIGE